MSNDRIFEEAEATPSRRGSEAPRRHERRHHPGHKSVKEDGHRGSTRGQHGRGLYEWTSIRIFVKKYLSQLVDMSEDPTPSLFILAHYAPAECRYLRELSESGSWNGFHSCQSDYKVAEHTVFIVDV